MKHARDGLIFPDGFLWGAATSAHQVEGNNINNDWWEAEQSGKVPFQSGKACNQYELFEHDFDLARGMNHNAHRLSIEWSRIEPQEGVWDERAIEHYRRVLLALRRRGMKSFVTLHHFTNPLWFARSGGWENKRAPEYFERYAKIIAERLGEYIDFYITINEPLLLIAMGYWEGIFPPFKRKSFTRVIRIFNNLVDAHNKAFDGIKRKIFNAQIGCAANLVDFQPRQRFDPFDVMASTLARFFWNKLYIKRIIQRSSFIGVNYYFHHHIDAPRFLNSNSFSGHKKSDRGWGIHPEGLYYVLMQIKKYKKPIYITENGLADSKDSQRSFFIIEHLRHLHQAITDGCDVRGYLYWSLIDNFEWEQGFEPRFGLYKVDYKTLHRIARPSSKLYGHICKDNALTSDILKQ